MAVAVNPDGQRQPALQSTDEIVAVVKLHVNQAREARRPIEKIWLSNEAFAAGQHWLVWSDTANQLVERRAVDPTYRRREMYTANRIREYLNAQMGELSSGDDRPELVTAQDGDQPEDAAGYLNDGVAYAWREEWRADQALRRARGFTLVQGTAAIRSRFDKTLGPVAGQLAVTADGQPVTDQESLAHLEQNGTLPDGSLPRFVSVNEGRTRWTALSAFNILMQPGITHEDDASWFVIQEAIPIDTLLDVYGDAAAGLTEDGDIASTAGLTTTQQQRMQPGSTGRLRGHAWLFTHYELPCRRYPNGRVTTTASNSYRLLAVEDHLDYQLPDGTWHTGVGFMHWNRLNDRFYSQAFIEPMKDPQRSINEIKSVQLEILWRGLPKVFTKEGDLPEDPAGLPLEVVELKQDAAQPVFFGGIGPGPWMDAMLAACDNDLTHASTLSPLRLGENPPGVDVYRQLALLNENEGYKRSSILSDHFQQIATLVKCGVQDMRRYWPEQKKIMVSGPEEGAFKSQTFLNAKIPVWFMEKVGEGAAIPRSQAAELSKIDAIWAAAAATGVITGPNAQKWAEWYDRSVDAAEAQDLPEEATDSQAEVAKYENSVMMNTEEVPPPAAHDIQPTHMPIHREALDQARAAGDIAAAQRIQHHIDLSTQAEVVARKQWRFADPADTNDMASELALDEDQALRENEMMIAGQPLNPEEYRKAYAILQRGTNPETMQPVAPTDDLRMLLLRASLKPTLIENLSLHLDRHGNLIKSQQFQSYPPDVRERCLLHFDMTRDLFLSLPLLPTVMVPPKTTLNIRSDVGESTVAKILHRSGVPEADPAEIGNEPPLETVVSVVDTLKDQPLEHENPLVPDGDAAPPAQGQ